MYLLRAKGSSAEVLVDVPANDPATSLIGCIRSATHVGKLMLARTHARMHTLTQGRSGAENSARPADGGPWNG